MYSELVEQLAQSLNEKDLIISGMGSLPNSAPKPVIFGMCRLDNLETSLYALAAIRKIWTPDATAYKPGLKIDVRIRNMNSVVEIELLKYHPVLCTVDLDNLTVDLDNLDESLVAVPQLS